MVGTVWTVDSLVSLLVFLGNLTKLEYVDARLDVVILLVSGAQLFITVMIRTRRLGVYIRWFIM